MIILMILFGVWYGVVGIFILIIDSMLGSTSDIFDMDIDNLTKQEAKKIAKFILFWPLIVIYFILSKGFYILRKAFGKENETNG